LARVPGLPSGTTDQPGPGTLTGGVRLISPEDDCENVDGTELFSFEMVDTALISHGDSPSVVPPL
jgi:hypothetical protein